MRVSLQRRRELRQEAGGTGLIHGMDGEPKELHALLDDMEDQDKVVRNQQMMLASLRAELRAEDAEIVRLNDLSRQQQEEIKRFRIAEQNSGHGEDYIEPPPPIGDGHCYSDEGPVFGRD